MLIIKYERKDFFGSRQYTEDAKKYYTKKDIQKAFSFIAKNCYAAMEKERVVYFWDSLADFKNRIITVRTFTRENSMSYTEAKKSYDLAKKECYATIQ